MPSPVPSRISIQPYVIEELEEYDWLAKHDGDKPFKRKCLTINCLERYSIKESRYDRCLRFLEQLSSACTSCTMCELGRQEASKDFESRDPHVFSNLNPKRIFIVAQNPGWDEVKNGEPLIGASGKVLNKYIEQNGLSRDDFYICNIVRCWTKENAKPTRDSILACMSFLDMEVRIILPKLIVTAGAAPFEALCPNAIYSESLGKLTHCDRYGIKVFAMYHPSPRNLSVPDRKEAFVKQVSLMCALAKRLND